MDVVLNMEGYFGGSDNDWRTEKAQSSIFITLIPIKITF